MRWFRRVRRTVGVIVGVVVGGWCAACGGGNAPVGNDDPPGEVLAGRGPVTGVDEARARILDQYLGLPPDPARSAIVGQGSEPLVRLYELGLTAWPAETVVEAPGGFATVRLNRAYWLFWLDPTPLALLGHPTRLLYLAADDGTIIVQKTLFDPTVDGVKPLRFEADRRVRLLYDHALWVALEGRARAGGVARPRGRALSFGAAGLAIVGNDQGMLKRDAEIAQDFFEALGGEASDFHTYADEADHPATKSGLREALATASAGLGPEDKFFLHVAAHGAPDGSFQLGQETVTWAELRDLLAEWVTAGHINIIIGSCYGGTAVPVFEGWTEGGLHVVTATDAEHTAVGSEEGGIVGSVCWLEKIYALLRHLIQAGELTVAALEQAFEEARLTKAEIDEKVGQLGDNLGGSLKDEFDKWYEDYLVDGGEDDENRGHGEPQKGFTQPPTPPPGAERLERPVDSGSGLLQEGQNQFNLANPTGSVAYSAVGADRRLEADLRFPGEASEKRLVIGGEIFALGQVGDATDPIALAGRAGTPPLLDAPAPPGSLVAVAGDRQRLVLFPHAVEPTLLGGLAPLVVVDNEQRFYLQPPGPPVEPAFLSLNGVNELLAGATGTLTGAGPTTAFAGLLLVRFDFDAWLTQLMGFTADGRQLYAATRTNLLPPAAGHPGDLDRDTDVDLGDFALFQQAFGQTSGGPADLDGDGVVGLADLPLFTQHLTIPVEPPPPRR